MPHANPNRIATSTTAWTITLGLIAGFSCPSAFAQSDLAPCRADFFGGVEPRIVNPAVAKQVHDLCNGFYAVGYFGRTKTPLWSAERLTGQQAENGERGPRPESDEFHEDTRLPEDIRSTLADYKGSTKIGYDRGHMTPSADGGTMAERQSTFVLSNVVPQTSILNRGVWEAIEAQTRQIAIKTGPIYVVTGPAFVGSSFRWIGNGHVYVPTSTYKAIYIPGLHASGVYVCTNTAQPNCTVVSVSQLTKATWVDPFPSITEAEKNNRLDLPHPVFRERTHTESRP